MEKTYRKVHVDKAWEKRFEDFPLDPNRMDINMYPMVHIYNRVKTYDKPVMLEVGCGLGRVLKHFHGEGKNIYGFEYLFGPIKRLHDEARINKLFQANAKSFPIKNNSFDIVTAFGVFHCLEEGIEDALKECYRVLKPGGLLCASVQYQDCFVSHFVNDLLKSPLFAILILLGLRKKAKNKSGSFYKWQFNRHEWEKMIKDAGFKLECTEPGYKKRIFRKVPFFMKKGDNPKDIYSNQSLDPKFTVFGEIVYSLMKLLFPWGTASWIVCIAKKGLNSSTK